MSAPRFTLLIDGGRMARLSGLSAAECDLLIRQARQHPYISRAAKPPKIETRREPQEEQSR